MSGVERGDCHRGEVVGVLNIVSISMLGLGVGADLRSKVLGDGWISWEVTCLKVAGLMRELNEVSLGLHG